MNRSAKYVMLSLCLPMMACSDSGAESWRDTFGLNRHGPDEFQVIARPALTVPPEFNLVAPKDGAEYSSGVPAADQAHSQLLGTNYNPAPAAAVAPAPQNNLFAAPASDVSNAPAVHLGGTTAAAPLSAVSSGSLKSNSDSQFLNDAGAAKSDQNIRQSITSDNQNDVVPKSKKFYLFGNSSDDPEVDPTKEKQRIEQDKAQNVPPTTGDTATIDQPKSLLGNIFR